jgi:hypothetical protein
VIPKNKVEETGKNQPRGFPLANIPENDSEVELQVSTRGEKSMDNR